MALELGFRHYRFVLFIHRSMVLLLVLATSAWATPSSDSRLSPAGVIRLADYHGAAPVEPPPDPPTVSGGNGSSFVLGLGLTVGGLVLSGGGFAVLYGCRNGTECHGDGTTALGWALAAPGIIPLVVGLIVMYASIGDRERVEVTPSSSAGQWALGVSVLPGGALAVAGWSF